MARVFNEAAWKSDKVLNIQPAEWIPEYAWLYSIALVDGTFEASPRLIWMAAYAGRLDWDASKVGQLLDELERVGLLARTKDETGKVWGRWVGSEKFLPSKAHVDSHRYKKGRSDLFAVQSSAALDNPEQRQDSAGMSRLGLGVGVGVGSDSELEKESGVDVGFGFDSAAKGSEKEQRNPNPKSECVFSSATPTPKPRATPTAKKQVLSPDEYRTAKAVEDWKAELAAREPCPGCGSPHLNPSPSCDLASKLSNTSRKHREIAK
jgi:hypothetical protein